MAKKNIFIVGLLIAVLSTFLSGCTQPVHNEVYSKYCIKASDCVSETVLNPGCSHYCTTDCKEGMRLCESYYKASEGNKNLAQNRCIWNEPCKDPALVQCIENLCVIS